MRTIKPARNMRKQIKNSALLFAAICNREIGKDEAKEALRAGDQIIAENLAQMEYDEKHHPNRKIKFMES